MQRSSSVSLPLRTNRTICSILWPLLLLLLVLLIGLHQKVDSHHHHHQEEAAATIEEKPLFRVKRQSSSSTATERNRALGPSDDNGTRPEPPKALMVGTGVRVWTSSSRQSLPSSSSQLPGGQARRVRDDDNGGGGELRLVGGRSLFEGNVEIRHAGKWGSICDDEWDIVEAGIVCRQLGFVLGAIRATTDSHFGIGRRLVWMDDLFCSGSEDEIQKCPFAGWRKHNCGQNEAAGVVCATGNNPDKRQIAPRSDLPSPRATNINLERQVSSQNTSIVVAKPKKEHEHQKFGSWAPNKKKAAEEEADGGEDGEEIAIRLIGDRASHEGRVEVWFRRRWRVICGDGWSLPEANVVCRQLGLGAAQSLPRVNLADLAVPRFSLPPILSGLKCSGNEAHLAQCTLEAAAADSCPDSYRNLAGVICATDLPDLTIDTAMLENSAFLEDRSILFLQCAMEENCLSRSAYEIDKSDPDWIYASRRLLRFTAAIRNIGRRDFRPFAAKSQWQWHACHRHYHSMEVFAHFDILDYAGRRVAEGHKASFCLEDNECDEDGVATTSGPRYVCANRGDQGISVGCVDIYKHDLDCQWIDITDIEPGQYLLKVTINPELKVAEMRFDNNGALCHFLYTPFAGFVTNCTAVTP